MDKNINYWRDLSLAQEKRLKTILYELAGLVANPVSVSEKDWLPALKNGNAADARCLQRAWEAALTPNAEQAGK